MEGQCLLEHVALREGSGIAKTGGCLAGRNRGMSLGNAWILKSAEEMSVCRVVDFCRLWLNFIRFIVSVLVEVGNRRFSL